MQQQQSLQLTSLSPYTKWVDQINPMDGLVELDDNEDCFNVLLFIIDNNAYAP